MDWYGISGKAWSKMEFLYDPALSIRVGQYVQHLRFFNVFKIRQAHLLPKVSKQANFRGSYQKLLAEIELCVHFFSTVL